MGYVQSLYKVSFVTIGNWRNRPVTGLKIESRDRIWLNFVDIATLDAPIDHALNNCAPLGYCWVTMLPELVYLVYVFTMVSFYFLVFSSLVKTIPISQSLFLFRKKIHVGTCYIWAIYEFAWKGLQRLGRHR